VTLSVIPDALVQRVTAHLEQFGTLARPALWTGNGSVVAHFTTDLHVVSMDTRFTPLTVNWTMTFRSPDGAIYLNVPAAWRREGEGDMKAELTPLMRELLEHMVDGAVAHRVSQTAIYPDGRKVGFAANSLSGLLKRNLVDRQTDNGTVLPPLEAYVINPAGLAAINRPLIDPTAPIPANEIENADEPHDDIGTGVDPEPANNLPDVQPDLYEWFTVGDRAVRKSDNAEIVITDVDGDFISGTGTLYGEVEVGLIRHGNGTYSKAKEYAHTPATVTRVHRKHFCRPRTGEWSAATPEPEQSADPIYQDYVGTLLRVNDWVQTPAGLKGAIVGFKQDRMAVVALMSEFKSFDASTDIHDYLAHTLRRIDPPTPPNDPIDYEAYNGGLADAALAALEQADIERAEKADPYAWATPAKRDALNALLDRKHVYPQIIEPSTTEDVWRMEDEWKVKTMQRTLDKIGGELVGTLKQDWNGDEPYCVALFRLEVDDRPDCTPYPSKRQTKPAADPNSIHAQYDALHDSLPVATQLLIQANGDEWLAFQMDAMLLRRYAPLCRFSPQTVNQAGEQWDKLSIPAGLLDETVTNANEGGLTVALASIVRDEPGKLPVREVDEIHAPGEPVQYVGKEEPPTEWETEADADDEPEVQTVPIMAPKIEMTPALMAAKIKLHIHGALRLGLIESVTPMPHDGWFAVTFVHGLTEAFTVPALKTAYEVGDVWRSKRTVYVREQSTALHGTAIEQAAAVLENLSSIGEVFADAKARMEAFTAPDPEPTTVLLDHDAGADLIATLRTEHADLSEASLGITEFLLNVIARMRTTATVAAPF
jgi:hypothetical protein